MEIKRSGPGKLTIDNSEWEKNRIAASGHRKIGTASLDIFEQRVFARVRMNCPVSSRDEDILCSLFSLRRHGDARL